MNRFFFSFFLPICLISLFFYYFHQGEKLQTIKNMVLLAFKVPNNTCKIINFLLRKSGMTYIIYPSMCTANLHNCIWWWFHDRAKIPHCELPIYWSIARVSTRFFDQVGHQTTNASIGNKHFFTNNDFVRLTKIMNNLVKDLKTLRFKVIFQCLKLIESFRKNSVKDIWLGNQLLLMKIFRKLWFLKYFIY